MLDTPWVRASLDKVPDDVASMFDGVADRYDVANEVLALGQTRVWRKALVTAVSPMRGEVILDLAAGTGSSSEPLSGRGATVIPCDFSTGMLLVGHERRPQLPFTAGDALHLPFGDGVFDAATISFGLRNVVDHAGALRELRRVVRPGGRLVVCEFSHPTQRMVRKLCPHCRVSYVPAETETKAFLEHSKDLPQRLYKKGKGCNLCANTGFQGRTGLFEVMLMSDSIRKMLMNNVNAIEIEAQAIKEGLITMKKDGLRKVMNGLIPMEEVMRSVFAIG